MPFSEELNRSFLQYKEPTLKGRYITNEDIEKRLRNVPSTVSVKHIGESVNGKLIYSIKLGKGSKRILMWSQMHGNESTTTKALFDLINTLAISFSTILEECELYIIPILNPDGAFAYTRENANGIDLNRDAQDLSQPESVILSKAFEQFRPHFCFNLHGQRTIFSVGNSNRPATISFLAPAQDKDCTITKTRKKSMEVICKMSKVLQELIPNQVAIYDDAFNLNCVGDTFQSRNVPTILFEAGHFPNDYEREKVRQLIYTALITALNYIAGTYVTGTYFESYLKMPLNKKLFYDIIIRNTAQKKDIAIQYKETLINGDIEFSPQVKRIGDLSDYYGHKDINANGAAVLTLDGRSIIEDLSIDCVLINNEKLALKLE